MDSLEYSTETLLKLSAFLESHLGSKLLSRQNNFILQLVRYRRLAFATVSASAACNGTDLFTTSGHLSHLQERYSEAKNAAFILQMPLMLLAGSGGPSTLPSQEGS